MTKKVKLALVENEYSRAVTLKKRRSGLVKKVKEISILCDVKACLIMFSPKEAEPMVWPSAEAARNLLKEFNALRDFAKKKNETTLESYLKEKTSKVHENLRKTQKENMERKTIDQLKAQLSSFRRRNLDDLDVKEIYSLISFSKDAIMHLREKVGSVQHCPLRDPPVYPFEEQVKEFSTTTGGGQEYERARKTFEEVNMASIGASKEKQSYYLMDEWIFPCMNPPSPQTHQQIMMNMASYNNNTLDPRCHQSYLPYQGSSSNGDLNMEMEPIFPPMLDFPDFVGPVSPPYPFDFMSHEERSNIDKNNNNNPVNGFCPEQPPPANGATAEERNLYLLIAHSSLLRHTINEIQERHDAVKDIEKNLRELHQVFLDMAVLVEHQGAQLDDIESHVGRASSFIRGGTEELHTARVYQKNTRKWTCYAIIILIIILVVVVLAVVKPWQNNGGDGGGGGGGSPPAQGQVPPPSPPQGRRLLLC
ncbi:hypothetical protein Bca101_084311 [Brassica carinata]